MVELKIAIATFVLFLANLKVDAALWKYGAEEVKKWASIALQCGGKSQSPIAITPKDAYYDRKLMPFRFVNYDVEPTELMMENNGHTVVVSVDGTQFIEKGGLDTMYRLVQFHFHWGRDSSLGSEHIINTKAFPMELHFVHATVKSSVGVALKSEKGLAVLGFMFEISAADNPKLNPIIDGLDHIKYAGLNTTIPTFKLSDLIPEKYRDRYFRYSGSLTTPNCYQSVVWTVFQNPILISEAQMARFRSLVSNTQGSGPDTALVDNFRPPQDLNLRHVYTSDRLQGKPMPQDESPDNEAGASTILRPFHILILLTMVTAYSVV